MKNTIFQVQWGCSQNPQSQTFEDIGSAQEFKEAISDYVSSPLVYARIRPRPPYEIVDALQDRVIPASGRLLATKKVLK